MSTTEKLTGDSNIGRLYRYSNIVDIDTIYEQVVYMAIGRYSIGYCRPTTNVPLDIGNNRNSNAWAKSLGISKTSFLRAIKSLSESKLIKVHKGSLHRQDGGSYPDYYSLIFDAELQTKHNIFFKLDGTTVTKLVEVVPSNLDAPTTSILDVSDEDIEAEKLTISQQMKLRNQHA